MQDLQGKGSFRRFHGSAKPNASKRLPLMVPGRWYFGPIGIYFPGWQNPFMRLRDV